MIFLIPARAGSKRLPGKNKRLFCGMPLWMWSWATANRLKEDGDSVIVSSDDPDIARITGWPLREHALSQDDSPIQALIDYYLQQDDVCLLQPTSPGRRDSLVCLLLDHGGSVRSVTDGKPNGQCYVYRRDIPMLDVETDKGHDIDTADQFIEAENAMMESFS